MSSTEDWGQDVVVSLCLSLFLTLFFRCCFLLTNFLCSSVVPLWATVPLRECLLSHGGPPTPLTLLSPHSPVSILVALFPPCPLWCSLPGLSPPLWHFLPFPQYVFTEALHMWLMGSALARGGSAAEPVGIACEQHRTALTSSAGATPAVS